MAFETDKGILKLIVYLTVVSDGEVLLVQYHTPPNPDRGGWWIPAPELEFGQGPDELAADILSGLGLGDRDASLLEIESFETPTAWHCIFHYGASTARELEPGPNYARCEWFRAERLPPPDKFAHGGWERKLALKRIEQANK